MVFIHPDSCAHTRTYSSAHTGWQPSSPSGTRYTDTMAHVEAVVHRLAHVLLRICSHGCPHADAKPFFTYSGSELDALRALRQDPHGWLAFVSCLGSSCHSIIMFCETGLVFRCFRAVAKLLCACYVRNVLIKKRKCLERAPCLPSPTPAIRGL